MSNMAFTPDSVRQYLQEIGRVPLLTESEDLEVALKVVNYVQIKRTLQEGKAEGIPESSIWASIAEEFGESVSAAKAKYKIGFLARQDMINANLRLVVSIAKKYQKRNLELMDLIQEGA